MTWLCPSCGKKVIYLVQTLRKEKRTYAIEAASMEQAEERALEGYNQPTDTQRVDEFVQAVREEPHWR